MERYEIERYTEQEIDDLVEENKQKILEYCKDAEWEYKDWRRGSTMRVLFVLNNEELYIHQCGQGIAQELFDGINDGDIIEVYRFVAGRLEDCAFESLAYSYREDEKNDEAEELYKKHMDGEVSEDEYLRKYNEIIEPWLCDYYENIINNTVEINVDYLKALDDTEEEENYNEYNRQYYD